jgi:putative pyruvate formate lyase activating enzyme
MADGRLEARAQQARQHLADCDLCARDCRVNRFDGIAGAVCHTGEKAVVHSYGPHHGEEQPIRGHGGSGTIFFSWCSLRCEYCQNWEIGRRGIGREQTPEGLAGIMLELQAAGCHNINLVTPSHVVSQIIEAVAIAAPAGLDIPLVYNTGGYDSLAALRLLDGIVDIYMPDMKYGHAGAARRFSHARDYVKINRDAVLEMHRQVGELQIGDDGVASRGLLIRHLVLPGDAAATGEVLKFIHDRLPARTYVNLMDQYRPCYRAGKLPPLHRRPSREEIEAAVLCAHRLGLYRLDSRGPGSERKI